MATSTYTVKKGDTLSKIAETYKSEYGFSNTYTYVNELVKINDITDPNYIVVGQVIKLSGTTDTKKNTTSKAAIKAFGLQSNTDRTVYATWSWDKTNTENYKVMWYYATGDGVWFVGNDSTTTYKQSTYNAPTNATKVKFKVKPVSKTRKVNGKDTSYWTASWSTEKTYSFSDNPPSVPASPPSVTLTDLKLTASLSNLSSATKIIQFEVVRDDVTVFKKEKVAVNTSSATYTCTVVAGGKYKVRCRAYGNGEYSDWTGYSESKETIPAVPATFTQCRVDNENGDKVDIYLEWAAVPNVTSYDIQYATEKSYFEGSTGTTTTNTTTATTSFTITGLELGKEYFFRLRGVNAQGNSDWSEIKSTVTGKKPAAPTTWSLTTTAVKGESIYLYWNHNSADGSKQSYAQLKIQIDDNPSVIYTMQNSNNETALNDVTNDISGAYKVSDASGYCRIDTSNFEEGVRLKWCIRTAGADESDYGDWSVDRVIDIYEQPTFVEFGVTDIYGNEFDILESYPFYVSALAGPRTQRPTGYHITITANDSYETVDNIGNAKHVNAGEEIYSKYFDISESLETSFTPRDVSLENNISYTLTCTVSMNSGLTGEATKTFTVEWSEEVEYEPNAEIGINNDNYSAWIRPYCEDSEGNIIEGVMLSVYRREFDGSFTELATDISNSNDTYLTDPHPALDYARYRVVATVSNTGAISYYDIPGYPVNGKAVIIQWNEDWSSFESSGENTADELEQQPWAGSMLQLPYNVDISDKNTPDVALIAYIGRKYPVTYYGTQLGETSTWSMEIDKDDKEALYALRRLKVWMGDVYVREPSGSGYWANVKVSFNQEHCKVTVPVTIEVTRVEGGV